jgi:hypothetical protein
MAVSSRGEGNRSGCMKGCGALFWAEVEKRETGSLIFSWNGGWRFLHLSLFRDLGAFGLYIESGRLCAPESFL